METTPYKQLHQIVCGPTDSGERLNLVDSSRHGYIATAASSAVSLYNVSRYLATTEACTLRSDKPLPEYLTDVQLRSDSPIYWIAFNSDGLVLAVVTSSAAQGTLTHLVDLANALKTGSTTLQAVSRPVRVCGGEQQTADGQPGWELRDFAWSPTAPTSFALILRCGSVRLFSATTNPTEPMSLIGQLPPTANAHCLSWSAKGKQLAICITGTLAGPNGPMQGPLILQVDPQLHMKRTVSLDPVFQRISDGCLIAPLDMFWVSPACFVLGGILISNTGSRSIKAMCIHAPTKTTEVTATEMGELRGRPSTRHSQYYFRPVGGGYFFATQSADGEEILLYSVPTTVPGGPGPQPSAVLSMELPLEGSPIGLSLGFHKQIQSSDGWKSYIVARMTGGQLSPYIPPPFEALVAVHTSLGEPIQLPAVPMPTPVSLVTNNTLQQPTAFSPMPQPATLPAPQATTALPFSFGQFAQPSAPAKTTASPFASLQFTNTAAAPPQPSSTTTPSVLQFNTAATLPQVPPASTAPFAFPSFPTAVSTLAAPTLPQFTASPAPTKPSTSPFTPLGLSQPGLETKTPLAKFPLASTTAPNASPFSTSTLPPPTPAPPPPLAAHQPNETQSLNRALPMPNSIQIASVQFTAALADEAEMARSAWRDLFQLMNHGPAVMGTEPNASTGVDCVEARMADCQAFMETLNEGTHELTQAVTERRQELNASVQYAKKLRSQLRLYSSGADWAAFSVPRELDPEAMRMLSRVKQCARLCESSLFDLDSQLDAVGADLSSRGGRSPSKRLSAVRPLGGDKIPPSPQMVMSTVESTARLLRQEQARVEHILEALRRLKLAPFSPATVCTPIKPSSRVSWRGIGSPALQRSATTATRGEMGSDSLSNLAYQSLTQRDQALYNLFSKHQKLNVIPAETSCPVPSMGSVKPLKGLEQMLSGGVSKSTITPLPPTPLPMGGQSAHPKQQHLEKLVNRSGQAAVVVSPPAKPMVTIGGTPPSGAPGVVGTGSPVARIHRIGATSPSNQLLQTTTSPAITPFGVTQKPSPTLRTTDSPSTGSPSMFQLGQKSALSTMPVSPSLQARLPLAGSAVASPLSSLMSRQAPAPTPLVSIPDPRVVSSPGTFGQSGGSPSVVSATNTVPLANISSLLNSGGLTTPPPPPPINTTTTTIPNQASLVRPSATTADTQAQLTPTSPFAQLAATSNASPMGAGGLATNVAGLFSRQPTFGQQSPNAAAATTEALKTTAPTAASTGSGLFSFGAQASTATESSGLGGLFKPITTSGGDSTTTNVTSSTAVKPIPSLFGAPVTAASAGGLFGNRTTAPISSTASTPGTTSLFGNASLFKPQSSTTPATTSTAASSLFSFGSASVPETGASSAQQGASVATTAVTTATISSGIPATSSTPSLFGNSSGFVFGQAPATTAKSTGAFSFTSSTGGVPANVTITSTAQQPSLSGGGGGGGLFASLANTSGVPSAASTGGLFGTATTSSTTAAPAANSLFSGPNFGVGATNAAAKTAVPSQQSQQGGLFGNLTASTTNTGASLFGLSNAPPTATTAVTSTTAISSNLFAGLGAPATTSMAGSQQPSSLFGLPASATANTGLATTSSSAVNNLFAQASFGLGSPGAVTSTTGGGGSPLQQQNVFGRLATNTSSTTGPSLFGAGTTTTTTTTSNLFGGSTFGTGSATATSMATTGPQQQSLFGLPATSTTSGAAPGLKSNCFGNNTATTGLFGAPVFGSTTAQPAGGGSSFFGQQTLSAPTLPASGATGGGGLFAGLTSTPPTSVGGTSSTGFGAQSLFGSSPFAAAGTGSSFGTAAFGAAPSGGPGLFGAPPAAVGVSNPAGSLFGASSGTGGGGLFEALAAKSDGPSFGGLAFGSSPTASPAAPASPFASSQRPRQTAAAAAAAAKSAKHGAKDSTSKSRPKAKTTTITTTTSASASKQPSKDAVAPSVTPSNPPKTFYAKAQQYWDGIPATVDGMLGGYASLNVPDIEESHAFLDSLNLKSSLFALDCGSGIGRITKQLLIPRYNFVDMVDVDQKFLDAAKEFIGDEFEGVGERFCAGLQDFTPPAGRYDLVWIQWVMGHLTDMALVAFLKRCARALSSANGLIVVKENIVRDEVPSPTAAEEEEEDASLFDDVDSSFTRTRPTLLALFELAELDVISQRLQENFPTHIYPVWMFALRPRSSVVSGCEDTVKATEEVVGLFKNSTEKPTASAVSVEQSPSLTDSEQK